MRTIISQDVRQPGYTYTCTAPIGKQFDVQFKPDLTPQQMLELGIFGGIYFTDFDPNEFPKTWFAHYHASTTGAYDASLNFFKVNASQSLAEWKRKGWINETHDPRGWIQWYFRYYLGRRLPEEDARQIKRWKAAQRHVAQLIRNCRKGEHACRPRQRQALLHWAYDSRVL